MAIGRAAICLRAHCSGGLVPVRAGGKGKEQVYLSVEFQVVAALGLCRFRGVKPVLGIHREPSEEVEVVVDDVLAHAELGAGVAEIVVARWRVNAGEEQPMVRVAMGAEAFVVLAGGFAQAGTSSLGSGADGVGSDERQWAGAWRGAPDAGAASNTSAFDV